MKEPKPICWVQKVLGVDVVFVRLDSNKTVSVALPKGEQTR